ncbi:triacylglycerol lipase OBL1 [Lycium barbarum]|uniref:triacylglycerol lipase OBL1 n=1 Tax=Lycium barbarum TaxID=112863 RepID=UPI00293E9706|nr:triacylglycerol lipase OBL1 [Lycium barbarum]
MASTKIDNKVNISGPVTVTGNSRFLIVNHQNGGILDLVRFGIWGNKESGDKFLEYSAGGEVEQSLRADDHSGGEVPDHRWVIFVSILVRKLISIFGKPMEWIGYLIEFILNLFSLNGNFFGLFYNLLHGKVVMPKRGSETFISAIGHLDGRINLYKSEKLTKEIGEPDFWQKNVQLGIGHRALMDLCMMASKLAYENAKVVQNVVNLHWKMHFVDFFNCWNDFEKEMSTQVFILCDKPKDANLIVISFRGTEPFDADDWITDFDYSWYEIPKLGKVHMGFLEALGLGSRAKASTFHEQLFVNNLKFTNLGNVDATIASSESSRSSTSFSDTDAHSGSDQSTDSERPDTTAKKFRLDMPERTAYYVVRSKLKRLLKEHKNAKFVVTGHSLGGALAVLFPTVLVLHEEMNVMERLLGIYTYGQPRVGNRQLGKFMEEHLEHPVPKYFRVVYCNDLVPRLPYDNRTFLFKHFGICRYSNSLYVVQNVDEEPNRNFFGLRFLIPLYLNACWELIRSFAMGYIYGPEYEECWESVMLRALGLFLPGISAHSPVDYVNSVRLGRERSTQMSSF